MFSDHLFGNFSEFFRAEELPDARNEDVILLVDMVDEQLYYAGCHQLQPLDGRKTVPMLLDTLDGRGEPHEPLLQFPVIASHNPRWAIDVSFEDREQCCFLPMVMNAYLLLN